MVSRCLAFLLAVLMTAPGGADTWLRFETVALDEGLSQLSGTATIQDRQGFLWLGTQSGLNRYDGYEIRVFKRSFTGESGGLSDNYISALAETPDGIIWIGTWSGGLNRLDPVTESFEAFRYQASDPASIPSDEVVAVATDRRGHVWVGTRGGGAARLDPTTGTFTRYGDEMPGETVSAIATDSTFAWLGGPSGLVRVDLENGVLEAVPARLSDITSLVVDATGRCWVGTENGLHLLEPDGRLNRVYRAEDDMGLPSSAINTLQIDNSGMLWIGTMSGLARYRPDDDDFEAWRHSPEDDYSLGADRVSSILQDSFGVLWVGTWTGGISRVDLNAILFQGYRARGDELGLEDARTRDFVEDEAGEIWIATLGGGLARFDPLLETFRHYRHGVNDDTSIGSDFLHAVDRDADGGLWLGSRNAGVTRFDPITETATRYPHRPGVDAGPAGHHVLDVLVDSDNRLWVGTADAGLSILDIRSGAWTHYSYSSNDPTTIGSNTVGHIREMSDGRIWLAHRGTGLTIYDPASTSFLRVPQAPDRADGLIHGAVTYITEADDGEVWLATQGGGFGRVLAMGPAAEDFRFEFITTAQGLTVDAVGAVLIDEHGEVWASTLRGISLYEPATRVLRNFFPLHGTQKRAYYVGSGLRARDGTLYFGGIEGVTRLGPHEISIDENPPRTQITGIYLSNRRLPASSGEAGMPDIGGASFVERLDLDYEQNIFSIEFAGLHYTQPDRNRYQYQLVGFDGDWVDTPADRRLAAYTNLDPGDYVFRVRSANQDGVWSASRDIDIRIVPPPWRTNVAYMAYVLVALSLLGMVSVSRARQLAARREARRAIRESRERLDLALWGSGEEMWFIDLETGQMERISHLDVSTIREISTLDELWEHMHPDDRDHVNNQMDRHLRGETPFFEATYRFRGEEDQWIWALSKGRASKRGKDGRVRTIAGATKDITQLKNTERALRELNERLEFMVDERTDDLSRTNEDLRRTLDMLTEAQSQLVESEKMASLGNLVAGVAHEINTPVGVALTAATYMESQVRKLLNEVDQNDDLAVDEFVGQARKQIENLRFLTQNLNRAAELIKSFKQVAVDQSSEELRTFNVREYLDEILTSLHPRFKRTPHKVDIDCDPELFMQSYPGALYQSLVNLLINSLDHGFSEDKPGQIRIRVQAAGDDVTIHYTDNGQGFGAEIEARIFEPFFTTRRGSGGSGLGMHIVYNLVTNVLGGRITCRGEPGRGITVTIDLPKTVHAGAAA